MSEKEILIIEKVSVKTGESHEIACIPFQSGSYPTEQGELTMAIFEPRKDDHQKVVFYGSVIPTIQERGKKGQFQANDEYPRRVVNLPAKEDRRVMQPFGKDEILVFNRRKK